MRPKNIGQLRPSSAASSRSIRERLTGLPVLLAAERALARGRTCIHCPMPICRPETAEGRSKSKRPSSNNRGQEERVNCQSPFFDCFVGLALWTREATGGLEVRQEVGPSILLLLPIFLFHPFPGRGPPAQEQQRRQHGSDDDGRHADDDKDAVPGALHRHRGVGGSGPRGHGV